MYPHFFCKKISVSILQVFGRHAKDSLFDPRRRIEVHVEYYFAALRALSRNGDATLGGFLRMVDVEIRRTLRRFAKT